MHINRRHFLGASLAASASLVSAKAFAAPAVSQTPGMLQQGLEALDGLGSAIVHRDRIGLVDFTEHSREMRMQIADIENGRILGSYLVAHGRGSDPAHSGWVQRLSNRPGSNASCEGRFRTGALYYGKHGRSGRLHGLDPENSMAYERAIVLHGADYVSQDAVRQQGRIGRSLGCFAVPRGEIAGVLELLGEGRLLYASKQA